MQSIIPPADDWGKIIVIGKDQGWLGLAVNFTITRDSQTNTHYYCMQTAWEPTPKEMQELMNGGKIIIQLLGKGPHPPISVYVHPHVEDDIK